jgi:nucleoside-diphosphate-sugar epimerase
MQKILITGYTGFIGSNITKYLKDDILYGVDIIKKDSVSKNYTWEALSECTDIDCIIHLAGKAHDTWNNSEEKEYFDINVGLTQKVFQHFLNSNATKFIFFSSVKAVADSVRGAYLTEDELPYPKTPYGKSKLEAEIYLADELEKWRVSDTSASLSAGGAKGRNGDITEKKIYILRPCMIHGPGNKGNLNLLFKMQQKGLPWPLGAFENKRSFCAIENLLYVVQQLIDKNIAPGIYQVADDEALSTNELIKLIAESQDKEARIWNIPAGFIEAIARFGSIFHLPLNRERLKKLTESYVVSNQKIKRALAIEKMPVTAVEGLKRTLDTFKK